MRILAQQLMDAIADLPSLLFTKVNYKYELQVEKGGGKIFIFCEANRAIYFFVFHLIFLVLWWIV